jgi:hypothetical protein
MSVTKNLREVLKENKIDQKDYTMVKEFIEASKFYENLVKSGITKKRGNNLLPRDKTYRPNVRFNS